MPPGEVPTVLSRPRSDPIAVGDALFGHTRRALLALLFGRCGRTFHLRELARVTGSGHGQIQRELGRLSACELITCVRRGNRLLYKANRASRVCGDLVQLVVGTFGMADILRSALMPLAEKIELAMVVGPSASGSLNSEVHLVVVGTVARTALEQAKVEAERAAVRRIQLALVTRETFARERHRWSTARTLVLFGHFDPAKPLLPLSRRGPHQRAPAFVPAARG